MYPQRPIRNHIPHLRPGAALVELAICLPVIAFLVGASVEACDLIFLRNTLASASYSGTLEISRAGCTETSVQNQIKQVLDVGKIKNYAVTLAVTDGRSFNNSVKGDLIVVQVSAVSASNLRMGRFIPTSATSINVRAIAIR